MFRLNSRWVAVYLPALMLVSPSAFALIVAGDSTLHQNDVADLDGVFYVNEQQQATQNGTTNNLNLGANGSHTAQGLFTDSLQTTYSADWTSAASGSADFLFIGTRQSDATFSHPTHPQGGFSTVGQLTYNFSTTFGGTLTIDFTSLLRDATTNLQTGATSYAFNNTLAWVLFDSQDLNDRTNLFEVADSVWNSVEHVQTATLVFEFEAGNHSLVLDGGGRSLGGGYAPRRGTELTSDVNFSISIDENIVPGPGGFSIGMLLLLIAGRRSAHRFI